MQIGASSLPPQILGQPQDQMVATNTFAAFSVVVSDPRALTFQWQFNNTNLGDATNAALLLEHVSATNEGAYRVVLTNPSGSVTSAPAMLWIDSDGDGLSDSWELTHFGNLNQNATGDPDSDLVGNIREFLDGTDPADPESARYQLLVVREGGAVIKNPDQATYAKGQSVTLTVTPFANEFFHGWYGDVASRENPITLVMTNDKTVYARFTPVVFLWTNATSGNWETATNWTPNLIPGVNDSVIINSNVTVTLNTSAECADVTLGSVPTILTGSGTLTVRGNLFWSGTMTGSGRTILETNALLNLQNTVTLNARTLENRGTILWSGSGFLGVIGGAVVTNAPGGRFRDEYALPAMLGGGIAAGRFDNAGEFRKAAGSGLLTISSGLNFNNSGLVAIETNLLVCDGGFTNNGSVVLAPGATNRLTGGGVGSGTFSASAAAVMEWTGGIFTLNPGAQFNGAGLYRINSPATVIANASFTVPNLDLTGGTLDGTGTVTISNVMNWTGGTMSGSGRTIIPAGVLLNLSSVGGVALNTRTLENAGTVLWTGAGVIGMNFGSVITNRVGALFDAQNAASLSSGSGPNRFDNAGTFRKSTSAGTTTLNSIFNNSGAMEIQAGTLLCNGFFTNQGTVNLSAGATNRLTGGGTSTGAFTAPDTALVEWAGGTYTLNSGAQLNGAGLYKINGSSARVAVDGDVTVQNLDLVNGSSTLGGTGILTIASAMNWTAGAMADSGRTRISPGATLQINGANNLSLQRTLENGGNAFWTGAGGVILLNGVVTNRAGALFQAQNSAAFSFGGGTCRFDNAGTFRKTVSTGTTTVPSGVPFNNSGTVDLRSGILAANGGYLSSVGALLSSVLGGTTAGTNYGQLQVAGAVTLNGALSVDLLPGFTPATNDTFTVLTAGTRNGAFASFSYPSNRVSLTLSNSPTAVIVRVATVLDSSQPFLLPPQLSGSNLLLTWTASSNVTYRLENNADVGSTNWTPLGEDVTATSNTVSKLAPLTSSNRFYRVRVLP